jgi:hypothetical protein
VAELTKAAACVERLHDEHAGALPAALGAARAPGKQSRGGEGRQEAESGVATGAGK